MSFCNKIEIEQSVITFWDAATVTNGTSGLNSSHFSQLYLTDTFEGNRTIVTSTGVSIAPCLLEYKPFIVQRFVSSPMYYNEQNLNVIFENITLNAGNALGFDSNHIASAFDLVLDRDDSLRAQKVAFFLNRYGHVMNYSKNTLIGASMAIDLLHVEQPEVVTCDSMTRFFYENTHVNTLISGLQTTNLGAYHWFSIMFANYQSMKDHKMEIGCEFNTSVYKVPAIDKSVSDVATTHFESLSNANETEHDVLNSAWLAKVGNLIAAASAAASVTSSTSDTTSDSASVTASSSASMSASDTPTPSVSATPSPSVSASVTASASVLPKTVGRIQEYFANHPGSLVHEVHSGFHGCLKTSKSKKDCAKDFYEAMFNIDLRNTDNLNMLKAAFVTVSCNKSGNDSSNCRLQNACIEMTNKASHQITVNLKDPNKCFLTAKITPAASQLSMGATKCLNKTDFHFNKLSDVLYSSVQEINDPEAFELQVYAELLIGKCDNFSWPGAI